MINDYYVYVHRRATDNSIFYVGKGKKDRAYWKHSRSIYWKNIVAKHGYTVEIVQSGMQEWWAFEMEKELIAFYGRENLCNLTDGGEGVSGVIFSENARTSLAKGRKPISDESRERISKAQLGRKASSETRIKMSKSALGKKRSEEERKKTSETRKIRYGVSVICSNGMRFKTQVDAVEWVKQNVKVTATCAGINSCIHGKQKTAYGFKWSKD